MFEFEEIFRDETVASRAVAVSYMSGLKADHTAWQEHDRDAFVVGDVTRRLTGLAGLTHTHSTRPLRSPQDQQRYRGQGQEQSAPDGNRKAALDNIHENLSLGAVLRSTRGRFPR